jgi:hypothetical protein
VDEVRHLNPMTRTSIRIAGSAQHIRSRQDWGTLGDRVQTCLGGSDTKRFASARSAQQWINRYSASILPAVWGEITLGEAQEQGLLEVVTY